MTTPTDPKDDLLRLQPHLGDIQEAVLALDEGLAVRDGLRIDVPMVCAVGQRESHFGWGWGYSPKGDRNGAGDASVREWTRARYEAHRDRVKIVGPGAEGRVRVYPTDGKGWGRGFFQIDLVGDFAHLIPTPGVDWPVFEQACAAVRVLQGARKDLAEFVGHPRFEQAVLCRYNAGLPYVLSAMRAGRNPDLVTTPSEVGKPGDYGSDVQRRRDALIARYPQTFNRRDIS
jgi:hypothetical protein